MKIVINRWWRWRWVYRQAVSGTVNYLEQYPWLQKWHLLSHLWTQGRLKERLQGQFSDAETRAKREANWSWDPGSRASTRRSPMQRSVFRMQRKMLCWACWESNAGCGKKSKIWKVGPEETTSEFTVSGGLEELSPESATAPPLW